MTEYANVGKIRRAIRGLPDSAFIAIEHEDNDGEVRRWGVTDVSVEAQTHGDFVGRPDRLILRREEDD